MPSPAAPDPLPTPHQTPPTGPSTAQVRAGHPGSDVAFLKRIERTALIGVVLASVVSAALGGLSWAGGVLGGGLMAGISYWAIRSSVDALVALLGGAVSGGSTPTVSRWRMFATVLARHALLGVVAYVIIARLRLHPVGVLVGASAVVLAAVRESLRRPA